MEDPYYQQDKYGIHALLENALLQRPFGFATVTGCGVTVADGTLSPTDGSSTVQVASGTVLVDATAHTIAQTGVDLRSGDSQPRWDLVYVGGDGQVAVEEGTPEQNEPGGVVADPQVVERPAPPDLTDLSAHTYGTPLAIVWIAAGAEAVDSSMVIDRRVPPENIGAHNNGSFVADATDIDFSTNLDVTDNGDGTVTVDASGISISVEDSNTEVTPGVATLDFASNLNVTDEGNNEVSIDAGDVSNAGDGTPIASGTITLTSGATPAYDGLVGADLNETDNIVVTIGPSTGGQTAADYAVNHTYGLAWDDSADQMDIDLTVNWDTDPGTNIDVTWQAWQAAAPNRIASNTVQLSGGSAVVSTGLSQAHVDVALDPTGGGANSSDVKVSARAFYDSSADEVKVEILEDGTNVGNPTIGYTVVQH